MIRNILTYAVSIVFIGAILSGCKPCNKTCQNGGALDSSDCVCDCQPGWEGDECEICAKTCPTNASLDPVACDCNCDPGWCGPNCDVEIEDCEGDGVWSTAACECICPDGFCGDDCTTEIIDCVNGNWSDDFCECDCEIGWGGDDCSTQVFTDTDEVLTFKVYEIDGDDELFIKQVLIVNDDPDDVFEDLGAAIPEFGSNGTEDDFLLQFIGVSSLQTGVTYNVSQTSGIQVTYSDGPPGFEIDSEADNGYLLINDLDPVFRCEFEMTLVDGSQTILIRQGFAQFPQ